MNRGVVFLAMAFAFVLDSMAENTAPSASVGLPEEGYWSPAVDMFVSTNVALHFVDESSGNPTKWQWLLPGTDVENSVEQNPVATYREKGLYTVSMTASNDYGEGECSVRVQAGGEQAIWNIPLSEATSLRQIGLGWYGNYAGSNWLGMAAFAEKFKKPAVEVTIKKVNVYFASVSTITPDAEIRVSVFDVGNDGMPGGELAYSLMRAGDLRRAADESGKIEFELGNAVKIGGDFFIVVDGIPCVASGSIADDIAILCSPERAADGLCTAYHKLEILDHNSMPTGKYEWYKNSDDPVSMAIVPVIEFDESGSVDNNLVESYGIAFDGENLRFAQLANSVVIYDIGGVAVFSDNDPGAEIGLGMLPNGVYLIKAFWKDRCGTLKIIKR